MKTKKRIALIVGILLMMWPIVIFITKVAVNWEIANLISLGIMNKFPEGFVVIGFAMVFAIGIATLFVAVTKDD